MDGFLERMRKTLKYDEKTGCLLRDGKIAGCDKGNGYIRVGFEGKKYAAHRVVWLLTHGQWPDGEIDHINRNRSDNRIENLRVVTRTQNMRNRTGVAGVHRERGIWRAYIWQNNRLHHLGMFRCFGEAIKTRRDAELERWGPEARTVVTVEALA